MGIILIYSSRNTCHTYVTDEETAAQTGGFLSKATNEYREEPGCRCVLV